MDSRAQTEAPTVRTSGLLRIVTSWSGCGCNGFLGAEVCRCFALLGRLETGTGSVGIFPAHGEGGAFGSLLRNSSSAPILTSQLPGRTLCVRGIAFHPGGSFCLLFLGPVRKAKNRIAHMMIPLAQQNSAR